MINNIVLRVLSELRKYDAVRAKTPLPPLLEPFQELEKFRDAGNYFIHFSDLEKIGIRPNSTESTGPLGIYCYELDSVTLNLIEKNGIPYAGDRKYIHIFSASEGLKILNLRFYNEAALKQDIKSLIAIYQSEHGISSLPLEAKRAISYAVRRPPMGYKYSTGYSVKNKAAAGIWNLTRFLAQNDAKRWRSYLVKIGYAGVIDDGQGIIHIQEDAQAVFFAKNYIIEKGLINNPFYATKNLIKKLESGEKNLTQKGIDHYSKEKYFLLGVAVRRAIELKQIPPNLTIEQMDELGPYELSKILGKIHDSDILEHYKNHENYQVRAAVAGNLPPEESYQFAEDESESVRYAAAQQTDVDHLDRFVDDWDGDVINTVITRTTDIRLLRTILKRNDDVAGFLRVKALEKIPKEFLGEYADHPDDEVRLHVAETIPLTAKTKYFFKMFIRDVSLPIRNVAKHRLRQHGSNPMKP